jgi:spermidine/putrescine transport system ATP-binding protein
MSDRIAVMRDGNIEQIGTPRDIYDRPETIFVAQFIGETNLIKRGEDTIAIRPEHITLGKAASAKLQGRVENIVYFGTDTHFHVKLDDGTSIVTRQQNQFGSESNVSTGDRVSLTIAKGAERVLKA